MKFFSASDYEPAVIAVGTAPVGIIAVGAFPLGVVAIGGVPMGVISVASGAALGVVTFSCGLGVGVFGRVVGLGLGGHVTGAGLMLSWADEFPATHSVARHPSISPAEALEATGENWVLVPVGRGELQSEDVRFELSPSARHQLEELDEHRVYAKVHAVRPTPDAPGSFRDPADPGEPYLACSEVESGQSKNSRAGQVAYWLKMVLAAMVVLAAIGILSQTHVERMSMNRTAELTWRAQPQSPEGVVLPPAPETECSVEALVHTNGARRHDIEVRFECGGEELAGHPLDNCTLGQVPQAGGFSYTLRCAYGGASEWTDDDSIVHAEVPGFELDTTARRAVISADRPPMHLTLEVDELSAPIAAPLLVAP